MISRILGITVISIYIIALSGLLWQTYVEAEEWSKNRTKMLAEKEKRHRKLFKCTQNAQKIGLEIDSCFELKE